MKSPWQGRPVLVTGAGGFIGSHLAEQLCELGASVRALVHYNALGNRGWLDLSPLAQQMEIVAGDVTDEDFVRNVVRSTEVVFHLAALVGIPYSYTAPASYVKTNIGGTLNVLQAARASGCSRVVHTSTSETYGTARYVPIDEEHPLQAQSPYAASKVAADKLAESFHLSFGLPVVTVRPFNTFGPRQSARAVIPTIIQQCLAGGPVRLGSLTPTRDMNYVKDTVAGFVRAGEANGVVGETINLGTGREVSIGDLAAKIAELTGSKASVVTEEPRVRPSRSEVQRLCASNDKAKRLLGWSPSHPLEEGLAATIDWMRQNSTLINASAYTV